MVRRVRTSEPVGRYLSTYVGFNKVSDDDYFYDFGGTGLNVAGRNHLNQQGW